MIALASGGGGPRIVTHDEDAAVDYPQPYLILDLRSPAEFGECHVLQARSFPQRLLMQDKSTLEMQQFKNKDGRRSFSPCALALAARSRSRRAPDARSRSALSLSSRALTFAARSHSHRALSPRFAPCARSPRAHATRTRSRRVLSPRTLSARSRRVLSSCVRGTGSGRFVAARSSPRDRRRTRDRRRARSSTRAIVAARVSRCRSSR